MNINVKQKRNKRLKEYRNKKYQEVSFNKSEVMQSLTVKTMQKTLEEIEAENRVYDPIDAFKALKPRM